MSHRRRNYQKQQWEIEKENMERERREAIERGLERTEENFPSLGNSIAKPVAWGGRKFSELASEWKAQDDRKKEVEETGYEHTYRGDEFVMPQFAPIQNFVEPEEDDEESPPAPLSTTEETDWVTVDHGAKQRARRSRKNARIEERLRRYDEGEEPEPMGDNLDEEDDTCWDNGTTDAPIGKSFNS